MPSLLRDARLIPGACCGNCAHAYPFAVTLVHNELECRAGPPTYVILPLIDQSRQEIAGAKTLLCPRKVDPSYWCDAWKMDKLD